MSPKHAHAHAAVYTTRQPDANPFAALLAREQPAAEAPSLLDGLLAKPQPPRDDGARLVLCGECGVWDCVYSYYVDGRGRRLT